MAKPVQVQEYEFQGSVITTVLLDDGRILSRTLDGKTRKWAWSEVEGPWNNPSDDVKRTARECLEILKDYSQVGWTRMKELIETRYKLREKP